MKRKEFAKNAITIKKNACLNVLRNFTKMKRPFYACKEAN